jgi:hypothetical protein
LFGFYRDIIILRELRKTNYAVHWGPNFVTHVGKKDRFAFIGAFSHVAGLPENLLRQRKLPFSLN